MATSNEKIYELVDRTRRELSERIDDLQSEVANLRVQNATLSTKVYVLVFMIATSVTAFINYIPTLLKKGQP